MAKCQDTTSNSQEYKEKLIFRMNADENNDVESNFEDFGEFIRKMPLQTEEDLQSMNISQYLSFVMRKNNLEPASLELAKKEREFARANWLNGYELKCTIEYSLKRITTTCRIKDGELQFENGGCSFRLTKITKMKVVIENGIKCIVFTYDDMRGKRTTEIKFKIFVEKDQKECLYSLFARIIIEKLMLMGN